MTCLPSLCEVALLNFALLEQFESVFSLMFAGQASPEAELRSRIMRLSIIHETDNQLIKKIPFFFSSYFLKRQFSEKQFIYCMYPVYQQG